MPKHEEIKAKIDAIQNDPNHPANNPGHPAHEQKQRELKHLIALLGQPENE